MSTIAPRWRPIKSAPKDGRHLILCCLRHKNVRDLGPYTTYGKWIRIHTPQMRRSHWESVGFGYLNEPCCRIVTPTHWMPLPAPKL